MGKLLDRPKQGGVPVRVGCKLFIIAAVAFPFSANTANAQSSQMIEIGRPVVIDSPEPGDLHAFGTSVAVEGDHVLIGKPGVPSPRSRRERFAGVAYLFDTVGNQLCKFEKDVPVERDNFGISVSLSADYALIGALGDDVSGTDAGAAYLFSRDTCDFLKVFENPDPQADDRFGSTVSISGDNVLIGASDDDTDGIDWGGAYLFDANPDLSAPNDLRARLSNPARVRGDRFGWSVSVSGTHALVGASGHDSSGVDRSGAAYLYEIDSPMPVLVGTFHPPNPLPIGLFGRSVALFEAYALIGSTAPGFPGTAYLFNLHDLSEAVPPLLRPGSVIDDLFGRHVALVGRYLLVGSGNGMSRTGWSAFLFDAIDGGHVYTFMDPESTPTEPESSFRLSVAISTGYVVIGDFGAGADSAGTVFVYPMRTP